MAKAKGKTPRDVVKTAPAAAAAEKAAVEKAAADKAAAPKAKTAMEGPKAGDAALTAAADGKPAETISQANAWTGKPDTTGTAPASDGDASRPSLTGGSQATIPVTTGPDALDKLRDDFIATMQWGADTTDDLKTLVLGNISGFTSFFRDRLLDGELLAMADEVRAELDAAEVRDELGMPPALFEVLEKLAADRGLSLEAAAKLAIETGLESLSKSSPHDPARKTEDGGSGDTAAPAAGLVRVRVTGPKDGRWRAGRQFTADPSDPKNTVDVTAAELEAIKADPKLTHEVVAS